MNKIFKVIWSKSKQCYIVVSEIAKNKTGKKKIVVASILVALAMQSGMIADVMAADPPSAKLADAALAVGTNGVAIGSSAKSQSNQSVAIGYFSNAQAPSASPENPATAVGAGANANGAGTVALGLSANATGANAVALGGGSNGGKNKTEATAVETTAVGFNAKASNSRAAAIGSGAGASGSDSIAMGTSTVADSEKAIAIGANSKGTAIGATALGRDTEASGASATALGALASAKGSTATAVGMQASASGTDSVAVGKTASATNNRALAVGTNAKATGENSVAVGSGAGGSGALGFAGSLNSTAGVVNTIRTINYATTADGDNAVALGFYANAKNSGVAVGQNALAATGGVAIGKGVLEDTGNNLAGGVVMGQDSATLGPYSLAMGFNAFASGSTSMAVGHTVSAQGAYAVAMGRKVSATGTSTAIGHHATATNGGLAIGSQENDASNDRTTASAKGAIAIGKNTKATSEDAVAIGTNAEANRLYSVALGSGSTTATGATNQGSTTINGITYNFAGATGNPNMQVSVGNTGATRQIKNVAAGEVSATSTDAINGSQLYAVASAVKPLKYVSINSTATGTGSNVDNDGAQAPNSIAIGPSSTVTNQNSVALGNNAQSLSDDSIAIGRNAKAESGSVFTNTSRAIAIGSNSRVATNVVQGIAIGSGSLTDEGAVVTGDQSIAIGGNVKVDGHAAIAIGGDDARKAAGQQVSYTNTNDNEVTGTLQTAILNLTGYNLSNYKGTAASHAGVAYGTSALAGNAGVAIGTASDSMTRMNDKGQVVNNKPVTNAVAIGTGARANFDNSVAIGGGSNTDHYATKQVNAVIDGVEVKWSGGENISPGDVVSFGAKGFERQLKNVAPGEVSQTSTDAVNGSQIYSLARKVTNIMNGGSGSVVNVNATGEPLSKVVTGTGASKVEKYYRTVDVKDDGTLVTGAVAQTPTSLALVNVDQTDTNKQTQTPRILGNVANGVKDNDAVNVSQLNAAKVKYFSVNSSDAGNINNDGATGTDAIAIGPSAVSNAVGSVALGKDAKANGAFTVALGGGNWQFKGAQANGVGTTALGSNTKTQENINYQTAIGFGATTSAESALALGYNAAASAQNAIALGKGAFTSGQDSLAFGVNSEAKGGSALAMGPSAQANSNYVVSLGYQANNGATNNANGVSIGWAAGMQSNGSSNVGIGSGAGRQISGNNNVSIGNGAGNLASANLYTSDSIMLGSEARAINGTASKAVSSVIAIGKKASGGADSAIALGQGASSTNQNSIAIGTNSQATAYNGVAIGAYSVANTAGGVAGFNPNTSRTDTYSGLTGRALTSTTGAVAIGSDSQSRQLTGLAAGTQDTDAVNVAQLKSVNLAFKGNAGTGDVNLAAHPLTIQGNDNYITTSANGNTINISGKVQNITVTNGTATAANKGMADAQNVADAINNAVQSNAYKWKLTANGEATPETIAKDDTVDFSGDTNISVARNGKKITTSLKKDITVDSVKVNKSITTGSGSNQITLDGTSGAVTGRTFSGQSFAAGDNVLSNTTLQIGSTTNGNNVTITKDGLTSKAGSTTAKFGATGIDAGGQRITNVSSGGNVGTNAANITDVKNAVSDVTLKLDTNSKTGTVKLSDGSLKIVGANGIRTDLTGTNKDNLVIGLDSNTVNATTKGIGLSGDSGTMLRKFLKDGDADFKISGDGNLVTTVGSAAGVKVSVDSTKVKDLAVEAVTVSKANTVDNPITVTPIASTNSKDYAIGIDTTKLAAKTDLTYRANSAADANAKKISLSKGLNFVDGGSTVATVDNDGKVSFDLNTATKNQISTNTTNIATNTTDIAANKGNITKNTASIATNTAALARNISLGADTGTASSQSLSTADVAFNVKGATGDFISTNMNGNTVEISTTRATINSNATTGEASVTGNDGLATAKNVADAINKAADAAKAGAAWNITTNSSTTDKTAVKGGDTVDLVNGDNIEITQDGTDKKKITVATKKDITVDSVTANNKVTVGSGANKITLDGTDGSVTGKTFTGTTFTGTSFTGTSFTAGNTVINTNGLTNGTTAITGTGVTTDNVTVGGISIDKTTGINAGNNVISNVASGGTTLTNAANIGDVQNAVANLSQNLNITDGTHDGTVDLKNQKLNVAGANGVTATVNNQTITVGLDADTVNATTKGIGLTADTGSTGNKYLKDGDVSFAVTGDGSLVSTSATAAGVKVAVNSATITAGADGTVTGPTTDGVATAKNVADAINAAKKASKTEITANTGEATNATTGNVTLTSTTAADGHTIYDVKLNDKVTLGTGANAVTIDGTTGAITGKTATIGGVTVNGTANTIGGLSNTTWNGTAVSGRAATEDQLKAATGATTLKFTGDVATNTGSVNLKDDTFGIKGDGKYISTDVNGKNVNLTVSEAEVKKSAVAAVTVSTDTTDANNPLTVTPTTSADGTTKDYKVTIDGTKIANKTNLSYKANNGTAKQVSLADGLNFKNGTLTTASIDDAGVVKYDVNTASITAGTDGTITGPTTDGVATAQNVVDAINAAKKASKTEITANTGEAANATTGNVTLTSSTAVDGHTIYDVKLNDKVTLGSGANAVTIDGTAGKATIGSSIVDGVNSTFTTGGANAVKLDGAAGTIKTGTVTVTGGTTNDITGLSNTTVTSADFA
ncbi:ESPR-type extended signal peptide-containing protein, partial [Veillonella sp.]|uniref:ESPR-type extended signal peptide-containing protein n=1 Tax=Veillonella sp. TaxID=1926307 RepID=UPI002907DA8F|nr:ESPR-type extended signal peptide-containing protein [Veillonella sp.]